MTNISRSKFKIGKSANIDPRIQLMRRAKSFSTEKYSSGGVKKVRMLPKPVTLPKFKFLERSDL